MSRGLIINGFAVLAATSLLASCIREDISEPSAPADGANCISLQIITGPQTRADGTTGQPSDKAVLNSVDLFFYTSEADDNTPAVFKWHGTNATDDEKLNVSIPLELVDNGAGVNTLFGGNNQCKVYAVVNSSEATALVNDATKKPTISELRALKVTTAFFADKKGFDDTAGLVMFTEENPDPLNRAEGDTAPNVVEYVESGTAKTASGHIYVNTPAAKIDLFVKFADTVSGADPNEGGNFQWRVVRSAAGIPTAETHMVNGVKSVLLGGWEWTDESRPADDDYFDTRIMEDMEDVSVLRRLNATEDSNDYPYVIEAPFYTYPNQWASASIMELRRTTLLLKVDWGHEGSTDALPTYYTVPLNLDGAQIEPNKYYRVKVNINTLGGANFGKPVELEPSVEVLEWGHAALEADIREIRYLEVPQVVYAEDGTEWTAIMNNTNLTTIKFFSSHKVKITKATLQYYDYKSIKEADMYQGFTRRDTPTDGQSLNPANFTLSADDLLNGFAGVYIDEARSILTVQHDFFTLQANGNRYSHTTKKSYSPYEIKFTLHHIDLPDTDTSSDKEITIIQYPGIYTGGSYNDNMRNDTSGGFLTGRAFGYARVNGNRDDYGGVNGINTSIFSGWAGAFGATDNPVMYVITVNALEPEDTKIYPLHIGDPRMLYVNNDLSTEHYSTGHRVGAIGVDSYRDLIYTSDIPGDASWSNSYATWNNGSVGDSRKLRYYYPTSELPGDEHKYMIAPRFRLSSSCGAQKSKVHRQDARRRCASYQENGYPAGRWRLPTPGEIAYVARLQDDGIIPEIFGTRLWGDDTQGYWTSHGLYELSGKEITCLDETGYAMRNLVNALNYNAGGYVRCVYDEWYWVTTPDGHPDNFEDANNFRWGDKPKNNPQEQPEQN